LGFLVPFLGIGNKPAIFMVVIYSLLPIVKNTATGLSSVNQETLEAARGIGMTNLQVLFKIKLPLSLPVIMAGVRISAVTSVGLVTLAAFIGAGGLGYLIYSGIRTANSSLILLGAVPACALALIVDALGSIVEKVVTPVCFKPVKTR
jgi:osmoprotectant transport system permease protein